MAPQTFPPWWRLVTDRGGGRQTIPLFWLFFCELNLVPLKKASIGLYFSSVFCRKRLSKVAETFFAAAPVQSCTLLSFRNSTLACYSKPGMCQPPSTVCKYLIQPHFKNQNYPFNIPIHLFHCHIHGLQDSHLKGRITVHLERKQARKEGTRGEKREH